MFSNKKLDGFEYKGFTYGYDLDIEPDENCKTFHFAKKDGKEIHMPWSPYSNPTESDFMLWIDLGCPENISGGNNNRKALERIRDEGMITMAFDLKSTQTDWNRQNVRVTAKPDQIISRIIAIYGTTVEILNMRQGLN